MTTQTARHPEFTDEQRRAVTTRGVSISLSAGAGCGKTFVLTERYLDHFDLRVDGALSPDEIGRIVAITFTDRAAREMRDRIRRKCHERLMAAGDDEAPYWARLLRALDTARIGTIHSFCGSLLRMRAVEAGVDPQFTVLEQAQADTLLTEATDDEIRRRIGEHDEAILELAARFNLNVLREMVRLLALECKPEDFDRWLNVSADEQLEHWTSCLASLPPVLGRGLAGSAPARAIGPLLLADPASDGKSSAGRSALLAALQQLAAGPHTVDVLKRHLGVVDANARVAAAGRRRAWSCDEAYETFKAQAEDLREAVKDLSSLLDFDLHAAREAAVAGSQVLAVAAAARQVYARRKDELRVMDFDDLLVRARRLLVDPKHRGLVDQLGAGITLLLVDEFQDTDPLQAELVQTLCGPADGKLFFVGDYKQSIYRFRGADPHVFNKLRAETPPQGRQTLSTNFRSQPAILDFVNALFRDDLGAGYEPLRPHRPQVTPQPAVEFLWAAAEHGNKEKVGELRAREAEWIARRIGAILDGAEPIVWDAESAAAGHPAARPARAGDIAILFRALTDIEAYEGALRSYGIDYYLVGGHAFYAQQEIFDLVNLLRAVNSPADAVSLIGALRSGFFSLADETIFWLAQHPGGIGAGLFAEPPPAEIAAEQRDRAAHAARTIAHLRSCKNRLRISELIELAFALTGYDASLVCEFLGERKLANLLKLEEQARGFERGDFLGLADFIAQLSEFVVRQPKEPLAATHSEETNVVRLMSVHQAKGLEFPIVIVPDVDRPDRDPAPAAHFDPHLGPLVRMPAGDDGRPPSGYDLWRELEQIEDAAEMNRLLYVATTRAADYLIISGGVPAVGAARGPWTELLARRFDLASGRSIADMPASQPRPIVKVITELPPDGRAATARRRHDELERALAAAEMSASTLTPQGQLAIEPIPPDLTARRQYSFSRLAGTLHRRYERLDSAEYASEVARDPRGLGTLVHAALAAIDLSAPGDCRDLVERLAEQHLPDSPAEVAEAVVMVERFVASERARQIAAARSSHAEVEFLLGWPVDGARAGGIQLRGFIDRLYQDARGGWHVLDFKTNRLTHDVAALAAPYAMQMLVYALAAERILGASPASLTLHFLRSGAEHQFAWNDAAREKVVAMVDRGIEAEARGHAATGGSGLGDA